MQKIRVGSVVVSLAGRDRGRVMIAVGVRDGYADVCDGRKRRIENPKRKKESHLRLLQSEDAGLTVDAELTNRKLWKYLEPFRTKYAGSAKEQQN